MDKRILFLLITGILSVFLNPLQSQTFESRNYIKIPPDLEIIKTMKASKCPQVLDSGYMVHHEFKRKLGDIEYILSKTDTLQSKTTYPFDKEIKVKLKSLPGKANLSMYEKDSSTFLVNYWLSEEVGLKKGTTIQLIERKIGCDSEMDTLKVIKTILKSDTLVSLAPASLCNKQKKNFLRGLIYKKPAPTCISDTLKDWFKYSDIILKTYEGEKLTGVYANMYDRDGQYTLKLQNREYISYPKHGWEFGPLTIPFKYRPGYTKTVEGVDIKVKDEFIADLNIGAYGGYQYGRHRFRMEGNKLRELSRLGWSVGPFFNLSTVTLDAQNTTAGVTPFGNDEKSTIGIFSPGIAAMFTLYNFQLGLFVGRDLAVGQDRKNWNYQNRTWFGLGFGYSLNGFWKK